jgi:hypothetical protein
MKKFISALIITILAGFTVFTSTAALAVMPWPSVTLNRISLQMTAEQWAKTTNARILIGLDASVKETELNKLRSNILEKLDQMAPKADWNITRFERTEATSGLSQIRVEAETRVPETSLGSLYEKAKSLSKAGETYRIVGIDFSPNAVELEKVRADLRSKILADVKAELERLNKLYPDQKYYVHEIHFNENTVSMPTPMVGLLGGAEKTANVAAADAAAPPPATQISVSNKIMMSASVTLASTIPNSDK